MNILPRYYSALPLRRHFSSASARLGRDKYDALVVGGGHNGLVSAAYLAKSGKSVCVLEKRHILGGASVTEEIVPGYKFSRASYVLSLLRPQIFKDLELKRHGLKVFLRNPSSYTPLRPEFQKPGGPKSLTLGACGRENKRQLAQFSAKDAEKYEEYEEKLAGMSEAVDILLDVSPAELQQFGQAGVLKKLLSLNKLRPLARAGQKAVENDVGALYELITAPAEKVLEKWFESEPLKATLATDACIGAMLTPKTAGSGYVLLHHVMGELEGIRGAWGYPQGGMGAVSQAIANSAREAGAEMRVNAAVDKVIVEGGMVRGVRLESGETVHADVVLSNATPKVTFKDLMGPNDLSSDFVRGVDQVDYTSPVTKINVAVNRLPNFLANPNVDAGTPMPHHRCTIHLNCERSDMIEEAFLDASQHGNYSNRPLIEMTIPSSLDNSLAPPGHHVCLFFTQYTPYQLSGGRAWDDKTREEYANVIFDAVEKYAPGFKESIVGKEVLTPPDLEATFGLTGGNIFHGSMSLDQLFMTRPTASPESVCPNTPVSGLYLCGSGAHPGGGVMGAPGRIAAKAALESMGSKWRYG